MCPATRVVLLCAALLALLTLALLFLSWPLAVLSGTGSVALTLLALPDLSVQDERTFPPRGPVAR